MARTINSICKNYCRKSVAYDKEKEAIEVQISELKERLDRLYAKRPFWIDEMVKPIAKLLNAYYPDRSFEILGPFGLQATTSIHFYRKNAEEDKKFENGNCISITFTPTDLNKGELKIVDYSINLNRFAPNSIGGMNDMNHPNIDIPPDADIEWLNAHVK